MWTLRLARQVAIGSLAIAAVFSVVADASVQVNARVDGSANSTSRLYFVSNGSSLLLLCDASPAMDGRYSWIMGERDCSSNTRSIAGQNITVTATYDQACYKCNFAYSESGSSRDDTSAEVWVRTYALQDSTPIERSFDLAIVASVNATCGLRQQPSVGVVYVWTRGSTGTAALQENIVSSATESALFIENSTAAGDVYYCHGIAPGHTIVGNVVNGIGGVLLATYKIQAPPFAEMYAFEQHQYTDGDNVTVSCKALGYPIPNVTWLRRGEPHHVSVRNASIAGGVNVSFDIVSLSAETDRGAYVCVASGMRNGSLHTYNSAVKVLHARSKLAALWPALGIIAQVCVVALIIGVTEMVRTKKEAAGKGSARLDGNKKNADAVDSGASDAANVTGKQWKSTM